MILLVILWLFQIVYLDSFYKTIKKSKLDKATVMLMENLDDEDLATLVDNIASDYEISISIVDREGNILVSQEYMPNSSLRKLTREDYQNFYEKALEEGGTATIEFEGNSNKTYPEMNELNSPFDFPQVSEDNMQQQEDPNPWKSKEDQWFKVPGLKVDGTETVIRLNIQEIAGQEYLIVLNSVLTPVNSTVSTLQIQLLYISIILFILSLGIALLMSKKISKSIIKINNSAKELAKGNYEVLFDGNDYREIAELSDTLNYTSRELSRTETLQRELIANVSHDLRTPLTMIIAYSEGMRDLPGENTPENIQVIIDESKRLTNLVNDMLDISKLQSGVIETKMKKYNLTRSIESVMERYTKLKEQDGYNIIFQYDKEVYITADEFKIFQVIYNMVNNAINYTGEDKMVRVKQIIIGNQVRIQVEDTGVGIKKEDMPYVWERYYKVDKKHKRAITGTGLGLSISKNILELHDAEYGVESTENKGSTFWFQLDIDEIK